MVKDIMKLCLFALCIGILPLSVSPDDKEGKKLEDMIKVELVAEPSEITVGEPVYLAFTIKNIAKKDIEVSYCFGNPEHITILTSKNGKDFSAFMTGVESYECTNKNKGKKIIQGDKIITIAHRIIYTSWFDLFYPFKEEGIYFVKIVCGDVVLNQDVFSETLTIKVNKTPEKEREILGLLSSKDTRSGGSALAGVIYYPHSLSKETTEKAEEVIKKYPESIYTPSLVWGLAQNYWAGGKKVKNDYKKAIPLFEKFLSICEKKTPSLKDDCLYYLADSYYHLEEFDKAQKLVEELQKSFPNSYFKKDAENLNKALKEALDKKKKEEKK